MSALSVALLIFSFQFSVLLCNISVATRQAAPALRRTIGFIISNIGHRTLPKIWVGTFRAQNVQLRGKDFELMLTVKMETSHPEEGQFGSEFPAICNHCVLMTA